MKDELNYFVDLRANFNRPDSFGEPSGEELAGILAEGLPTHGITVLKTEGTDFCYYLECVSGSSTIELMVGAEVLDDQAPRWYIQPCAKRTFFGRKSHPESDCRTLLFAVDKTLHECDRVSEIRWFPSFDTPEYLALIPPSPGPVRASDFEKKLHPLIRLDWRLCRITGALFGPVGCTLCFACCVLFAVIAPRCAGYIVFGMFVLAVVLVFVVPMVLSSLIRREVRRISA